MRLPEELPAITGLVLTSPKENELVEIPIVSPLPTGQVNPVLAHWTYGLGRSVAFTSDAGRRWAKAWPDWQSYAAFWSQVIRWSMRPADRGNLTLNVRREQGRIKVVVDALDKNNQFLNFLQIQGNVVNPDLKPSSIELVQTAPGRYEATIENAEASGNYFVNLGYRGPDNVQGVISTGVSVPYSDEYRELRSNPTTLETLASLTDGQVVTWKFRPTAGSTCRGRSAGVDHFRRDPEPDQSPLVRGALADLALAGGLPVPGRRRGPPDRARRRPDQATPRSTNGRSCAARSRARPASTWTSSGAARPRSTSSSTAPASRTRSEQPAAVVRCSRRRRRPVRSANRCSKAARPASRPEPGRDAARPRASADAPEGAAKRELHQPPAQGQADASGKSARRTRRTSHEPAGRESADHWSRCSDSSEPELTSRIITAYATERIVVDVRHVLPNRWKPVPRSSARRTSG